MVLIEESDTGSGSGSRPTKKNKGKKIPQRGLGVAQLEQIRLEDQQRNDMSASSSSDNPYRSDLMFLSPSQRPSIPRPFYPPPSFTEPFFWKPTNAENKFSQIYSAVFKQSNSLSRDGLCYPMPSNVPSQRSQQVSSVISSGINFQREPPSNQNHISNSACLAGTKRQMPFHSDVAFDNVAIPTPTTSFELNESSKYSRFKCDESNFSANVSNQRNPDHHIDKRARHNDKFMDGSFLTLSCPMTSSPTDHQNVHSRLTSSPSLAQSGMDNALSQSKDLLQRPFYDFFSPRSNFVKEELDKQSEEALDSVDTTLKL